MTINRLRTPLQASDYKGFASGSASESEASKAGLERPPIPNYPILERARDRRRGAGASIGLAISTGVVVAAAGVLAWVVLGSDPAQVPAPSQAVHAAMTFVPQAASRIDEMIRPASTPALGPLAHVPADVAVQAPTDIPPAPAPDATPVTPPDTTPAAAAEPDATALASPPKSAAVRVDKPVRTAAEKPSGCSARPEGMPRLLCRQPQLASLDDRMNAAFADAVRSGAPTAELAEDQEAWVIRRDSAARAAPETVPDLYRERIAKLQAVTQSH